jgi:hypothetical protein
LVCAPALVATRIRPANVMAIFILMEVVSSD